MNDGTPIAELKKAKTVDPRTGEECVIIQALHKDAPIMGLKQHPANFNVWLEQPITRAERRRMKKALAQFTKGMLTCN